MSSLATLEFRVLIGQCFIIGVVSSVATLEWRFLIGQCLIIGIVSSVAILKMRASDWIVLWTMHHLSIRFCSRHSERKVLPVVLLAKKLFVLIKINGFGEYECSRCDFSLV